jgi:hypothetical protein
LHEINELVYFGTLETRKGLVLFCDALDAIPPAVAGKIQRVTFLGRESLVDGIPARTYLQKRAPGWTFPFHIITGHSANRTVEYLRQKNRLAVIPSLMETSADGVLECLVAGIPFVAVRTGGIPELIAPDDVDNVCFEAKPEALCAVLCRALTEGIYPARAVVAAGDNEQAWIALHESSFAGTDPSIEAQTLASEQELASALPKRSDEAGRADRRPGALHRSDQYLCAESSGANPSQRRTARGGRGSVPTDSQTRSNGCGGVAND